MVAAEKPTVAFVIASTAVSGMERRISRIFTLLSRSDPGRYHLIISEDVFRRIRAAKFGLEDLPNVHILKGRSILDRKIGAEEGWITNIGRSFTVRGYRSQVQRIVRDNNITILQVYLELMRFIGIFPMKNVKMIASLVSHLPKYYDGKSIHSRLLYRALRNYDKVDALYEYITQAVSELGVSKNKLNSPRATCVDHDRFKPEAKEPLVTFAGRTIMWKNPWLMLQVIRRVAARVPDAKFYMMGEGGLTGQLIQETEELGLASRVTIGYRDRPQEVLNKSLVHVCLDEYDNAPNQSTLEGMSSGCAIVATDVGFTRNTVSPDVGFLCPADEQAIAEKVTQLLEDPHSAERLGRAGREKMLTEFSTDAYLSYIRSLHDFETLGPIIRGVRTGLPPGDDL